LQHLKPHYGCLLHHHLAIETTRNYKNIIVHEEPSAAGILTSLKRNQLASASECREYCQRSCQQPPCGAPWWHNHCGTPWWHNLISQLPIPSFRIGIWVKKTFSLTNWASLLLKATSQHVVFPCHHLCWGLWWWVHRMANERSKYQITELELKSWHISANLLSAERERKNSRKWCPRALSLPHY